MSSKNTFVRVLFAICLVTAPVLVACEAALDFNREKIQRYISSDGAASSSDDQGGGDEADSGEEPADSGNQPQDSGQEPKDSGTDADTGTGN